MAPRLEMGGFSKAGQEGRLVLRTLHNNPGRTSAQHFILAPGVFYLMLSICLTARLLPPRRGALNSFFAEREIGIL